MEAVHNEIVGYLTAPVFGEKRSSETKEGCRWYDCAMGRLITKAMSQACHNCDIILLNGGSIRGSFLLDKPFGGNITRADVLEVSEDLFNALFNFF